MAGLLDRVRPRHLAAWRSSFAWSGCATASPKISLIRTLVVPQIVCLQWELGNA